MPTPATTTNAPAAQTAAPAQAPYRGGPTSNASGPLSGRTAQPLPPRGQTGAALEVVPATGQPAGQTQEVDTSKSGYLSRLTNCTDCCSWGKVAKWVGIALFVSAIVVALVSTLVYTGVLSVALMNVGAMTTEAALYGMLTGIGVAGLMGIGAAVFRFLQHRREAANAPINTENN